MTRYNINNVDFSELNEKGIEIVRMSEDVFKKTLEENGESCKIICAIPNPNDVTKRFEVPAKIWLKQEDNGACTAKAKIGSHKLYLTEGYQIQGTDYKLTKEDINFFVNENDKCKPIKVNTDSGEKNLLIGVDTDINKLRVINADIIKNLKTYGQVPLSSKDIEKLQQGEAISIENAKIRGKQYNLNVYISAKTGKVSIDNESKKVITQSFSNLFSKKKTENIIDKKQNKNKKKGMKI